MVKYNVFFFLRTAIGEKICKYKLCQYQSQKITVAQNNADKYSLASNCISQVSLFIANLRNKSSETNFAYIKK